MKFGKVGKYATVVLISLITIIGLSDIAFIFSGRQKTVSNDSIISMPERIILSAQDGKKLAALYFPHANPSGWVAYFHMMGETKESFVSLAARFQERGYAGIAVDLRGHGESDEGPEGYLSFTDDAHQKSLYDIAAAVNFLKTKGASREKIILIGASIGANLSLRGLSQNLANKAVLLSPGLDYRGITAKDAATKVPLGSFVMVVSSEDDGLNVQDAEEIFALLPEGVVKEKYILKNAGHGTTMIEKDPALVEKITQFVFR